ncbi:hypothetical protein F5B17DRAFT_153276 [Nemania serpens]|nr:hypothetical protein F5B17DRAFT_153276 [Nemania serpens]
MYICLCSLITASPETCATAERQMASRSPGPRGAATMQAATPGGRHMHLRRTCSLEQLSRTPEVNPRRKDLDVMRNGPYLLTPLPPLSQRYSEALRDARTGLRESGRLFFAYTMPCFETSFYSAGSRRSIPFQAKAERDRNASVSPLLNTALSRALNTMVRRSGGDVSVYDEGMLAVV